ncbi:MAG: zinc ABC transporter substrate-binding protein [Clostridia bacterium]|nr:zinc ABC transporter substrate-binding protein [Clostridia bacterium]
MKKRLLLIALIILSFSLVGCEKTQIIEDEKLNIITSFYPMYIATANIVDGVEDVTLECLASPEVGCLHDYQLTVNDMKKLEGADVFVINGGGMESFLDKAISVYPEIKIINASTDILEEHHEEHKHEEGHHHEENPHVWVSVSLYIEQIKNIVDDLKNVDPQNADKYEANAKLYIEKLTELKNEMHIKAKTFNSKNIVTFHEAFEFFAEEFDLNIVAVIEREPGTSPSAKDLVEIVDTINELEVNAIFVEPQYLKTAATTIANETKVNTYELDPVVSGTFEKDAYEKIMRKNIEVLEEALK